MLLGYIKPKSHALFQMPGSPELGFTEFPVIKSGKLDSESLKITFMKMTPQQLKILWGILTDHEVIAGSLRQALATREKVDVKNWYQFSPVLKGFNSYFKTKTTSDRVIKFASLYMTHILLEVKVISYDGGINSFVDASEIMDSANVFDRTIKAFQFDSLDFDVSEVVALINKKINRSQIGVQACAMYISNYFRAKQMELMKLQQETGQIQAGLEIAAQVLEQKITKSQISSHSVVSNLTKSINFALDFVSVKKQRVTAAIKDIDTAEMLLYLSTLEMFISKYFEYGNIRDMVSNIDFDVVTCHDDDDVVNSVFIWKESDTPNKYNVFNSINTGNISYYSATNWEPSHYPLSGSQFIPQMKKIMSDLSVEEFKQLEFDDEVIGLRSVFEEYNIHDNELEPMIITNCSPLEINLMLISMFKDGAQFADDGSIKYVHIGDGVRIKSPQVCEDNCTITPTSIITTDPADALFGLKLDSEIKGDKIQFVNPTPTIMPSATSGFYDTEDFMDSFTFPDTSDYNKDIETFENEYPQFVVKFNVSNENGEVEEIKEMISIGQELTGVYDSSWPQKKHVGHVNEMIDQYLSFKDAINKSDLQVDSAFRIFEIALLSGIITQAPDTLRLTRHRLGKLRGKREYRKVELDIALKYATTMGKIFGKWNGAVVKELYDAVQKLDSAEVDALATQIISIR